MPTFHADEVDPNKPTPGLGHMLYRAGVSTMEGIDTLGANTFDVASKVAGLGGLLETPLFSGLAKTGREQAEKRRKELESDTKKPVTTMEKVTEGTVRALGSAIPYMAARGPLGAATVGALESEDKGPAEMVKSGVKAAVYSKAGEVVGKEVGKVGDSVSKVAPTLTKAVPGAVKRAASGAATGALTAQPGEVWSQALAGAVAGASQREGKDANTRRAEKLQAATGATGRNAIESYKVVGDQLAETARITGRTPESLPELLDNVKETNGRLENEFQTYMKPIENQQVTPTTVRDAILSKIYSSEANNKTAEGTEANKELQKRAAEFNKPWTVKELNDERMKLFKALRGLSAEDLKARGDASVRADRAAEEALKDIVYSMVDFEAQAEGKPAGYVRGQLKTQQANLIQLQDALIKRKDVIAEKEGIKQGTPITQRANVTLAAHPRGHLVGSIHGLMNRIFGDPDSMKEINKRVSEGFSTKPSQPANRVQAVVTGQATRPTVTPPVVVGHGNEKGTPIIQKPAGTVKMRAPDGSTRDIPKSEVDHWKSKGATVVQ